MTQLECSVNDWREVDRRLSTIAKQRAALDAEEARWLREAARVKIWREVGCVSLLDYLERRLGYGPRAAQERIRVARALEDLPALEAALANGMPYTAIRELTRVATRETEQDWIDACRDASVHEIEGAVSGHRKGSRPSDPAEPDLATRPITFEDIAPTTLALLRQARQKLQDERGVHLSDNDLLAAAFSALIQDGSSEEYSGRAKFQIGVVTCERCDQGWQEGAGRRFAMERANVERARCDAQHIGSLDGDPERATQDVPPRVRRHVFRRDGGKCSFPGCRSTSNLELHHIRWRMAGGSHDPSNLILLCDGCHSAHHRGLIEINGTAEQLVVERRHEFVRAHVGASAIDRVPVDASAVSTIDRAHEDGCVGSGGAVAHGDRAHVGASAGLDRAQVAAGTDGTDRTHVIPIDGVHVGAGAGLDRAHVGVDGAGADGLDRAHVVPIDGAHDRHLEMSKLERVTIRAQALDALGRLGFKRHEVREAVDAAFADLAGARFTLESFLRVALSKAPRPRIG